MNRRITVTVVALAAAALTVTPALAKSKPKPKPKPIKGSWSFTDTTPDPSVDTVSDNASHCHGKLPAAPTDVNAHTLKVNGRGLLTVNGSTTGDWAMEVRDPTALLLQAHLPVGGDVDKVLRTIDEECERIATDGLTPDELARTQARMATHLLRDTDAVLGRALRMSVLEQQRGNAGLINDLPRVIGEVTEEQVVAAAATLRPARRATVEVQVGATK